MGDCGDVQSSNDDLLYEELLFIVNMCLYVDEQSYKGDMSYEELLFFVNMCRVLHLKGRDGACFQGV